MADVAPPSILTYRNSLSGAAIVRHPLTLQDQNNMQTTRFLNRAIAAENKAFIYRIHGKHWLAFIAFYAAASFYIRAECFFMAAGAAEYGAASFAKANKSVTV